MIPLKGPLQRDGSCMWLSGLQDTFPEKTFGQRSLIFPSIALHLKSVKVTSSPKTENSPDGAECDLNHMYLEPKVDFPSQVNRLRFFFI